MKLSGSPEVMAQKVFDAKPGAAGTDSDAGADAGAGAGVGAGATEVAPAPAEEFSAVRMFQLVYRNGRAIWK